MKVNEKAKEFLKRYGFSVVLATVVVFSMLGRYILNNLFLCENREFFFYTETFCYKLIASDFFLLLKSFFIDDHEYISDGFNMIVAIIVAIPAFLLPLFFSVFSDKIKGLTTNPEVILDGIIKSNRVKEFYFNIFIFISYLILQNYMEIFNLGVMGYIINMVGTFYFLRKSYLMLSNVVFKKGKDIIFAVYKKMEEKEEKEEKEKVGEIKKNSIKEILAIQNEIKSKEIKKFKIENLKNIFKGKLVDKRVERREQSNKNKMVFEDIIFFIEEKKEKLLFEWLEKYFDGLDGNQKQVIFIKLIEYKLIDKLLINTSWKESNLIIEYLSKNKNFHYILIKESVEQLEVNNSFFTSLVALPRYFIEKENYNIEKYFYYCFELLNDIFWKKHINRESNYLIGNKIENKYYSDIFKENCESIVNRINYILRFNTVTTIKSDSLEDFEGYFNNVLLNILESYTLSIIELTKTGNADAVEIIVNSGLKEYCSKITNIKDLDLKYRNSLEVKLLNVDIFKENNKLLIEIEEKKKIAKPAIYSYLIQNTVIDYTLNLFEVCSEKYLEYLETAKEHKNVFILDIIKKLIYRNSNFKDIEMDFKNIFYSILRIFLLNEYKHSIYKDNYLEIQQYFIKIHPNTSYCFNVEYPLNFKIILLICKYTTVESKLLKDKSFNVDENKIKDIITGIEKINYEKYETYIKTIFEKEITENIFNDNKTNILNLFKTIKENLKENLL